MLGCRREVVACGEALAGHWWRTASLALLEGSAARAGQARCSAALGGVRAFGLEHGFCELASAGIGDFGRKKMREAAGHAVYRGRFVLPESKKPPVVASDDGQELLFLGSVRLAHKNNDFLPVKRFGRRFGCVELLAGFGKLYPSLQRHDHGGRGVRDAHEAGFGGELVLVAFIRERIGHKHERTL